MMGTVTSPKGLPSTNALRARSIASRLESRRHAGRHDGTDTGAAEPVDRRARFIQRAIDAQVRKPASGAATEHEADGAPGNDPCEAIEIALHAGTDVQVKIQLARREPRRRARQRFAMLLVPQHQCPACNGGTGLVERLHFPGARRGIVTGLADQQDEVRVVQRHFGEDGVRRIRHVHDEAMLVLLDGQPVDHRRRKVLVTRSRQLRCARITQRRRGQDAGGAEPCSAPPSFAASASAVMHRTQWHQRDRFQVTADVRDAGGAIAQPSGDAPRDVAREVRSLAREPVERC